MKSILVPVQNHNSMPAVLETAALAGTHLDAIVTGAPLRTIQFQVAGAEPIVAVSFPPPSQNDDETISQAKTLFAEKIAARLQKDDLLPWRGEMAIDDISLGYIARVYDLIVLGRPSAEQFGARMSTLESVLLDSGRPVLIAPPETPSLFGQNIVISWNCSTEAARTLAFAMPLLHKADEVSVLTVEEASVQGPSGEEVCRNLEANGITARNYVVSAGGLKPGAVILSKIKELGCDLLIKSAYTQSRLRQMIFGGATSHILANADLPVFMAN